MGWDESLSGDAMSLMVALLASTALASSTSGPAVCAGCALDAPAHGQAMPLLVVLRAEHDEADRAWRAPALGAGWAVLSVTGWDRDPSWLEEQVFAAARQHSIDLARVYLVGGDGGAAYIARHVQALSETFAAVVITGGGVAAAACPDAELPAYFWVEADDRAARTMRASLERCKQAVVWNVAHGALDKPAAVMIFEWLHRRLRVTTVS
jgi:poly(3-hydroxybutyrate) depolymerase